MRKNLEWGMMMLPETCSEFMERNRRAFNEAKGSGANHQAWVGGYLDHLDECFGIAALLYWPLAETRPLPFELADAILVLWLHDIEKVWKHSGHEFNNQYELEALRDKDRLTRMVIRDCNIEELLQPEHWNAIENIHGELDEFSKTHRVSGPLGAFCHMCDYWSARGWFDEPHKSGSLRRLV